MVWSLGWAGPDGNVLVSGGFDKTARVWDATPRTGPWRAPGAVELPDRQRVNCVAVSPDGRRIATAGWAGEVRVRRLADPTGEPVVLTVPGEVWGLAFDPRTGQLAVASWDKKVRVWAADTGHVRELDPGPMSGPRPPQLLAHGVAYSPDGRRLAATDWAGGVSVWDVASWKQVHYTAKVWDLSWWGGPPRTFHHRDLVWGAAFTPDGKRLATAGWDRTMVWPVGK
jgi:WD40 repeat protein